MRYLWGELRESTPRAYLQVQKIKQMSDKNNANVLKRHFGRTLAAFKIAKNDKMEEIPTAENTQKKMLFGASSIFRRKK